MDRPMVNVYELDADGIEKLIYRPMNDEELADWEARQAENASISESEHPVLAAVRSMSDEDKAALRAALGIS